MNRITMILLIVSLVFLVPAKYSVAEGSSEETKQVILALFEAFNRHDTDALVALYSEDTEILSPGDTTPRLGRAAVREIYDSHFDNIPGVHDAVQHVIADGEKGSVEFIASWDQPTESDARARGELRIAAFLTVINGEITRDTSYYDRMELSEAMAIK